MFIYWCIYVWCVSADVGLDCIDLNSVLLQYRLWLSWRAVKWTFRFVYYAHTMNEKKTTGKKICVYIAYTCGHISKEWKGKKLPAHRIQCTRWSNVPCILLFWISENRFQVASYFIFSLFSVAHNRLHYFRNSQAFISVHSICLWCIFFRQWQ